MNNSSVRSPLPKKSWGYARLTSKQPIYHHFLQILDVIVSLLSACYSRRNNPRAAKCIFIKFGIEKFYEDISRGFSFYLNRTILAIT
jgi:hypothetical protein